MTPISCLTWYKLFLVSPWPFAPPDADISRKIWNDINTQKTVKSIDVFLFAVLPVLYGFVELLSFYVVPCHLEQYTAVNKLSAIRIYQIKDNTKAVMQPWGTWVYDHHCYLCDMLPLPFAFFLVASERLGSHPREHHFITNGRVQMCSIPIVSIFLGQNNFDQF